MIASITSFIYSRRALPVESIWLMRFFVSSVLARDRNAARSRANNSSSLAGVPGHITSRNDFADGKSNGFVVWYVISFRALSKLASIASTAGVPASSKLGASCG